MYKGKSDKAAAILAQAARINRTNLPKGKLVTLEEKEYHLQLSKDRQPEATANRDNQILADEATDVPMTLGVRYRKEVANGCYGDEEMSSQEDHSVDDTIEMVAIASDSDQAILLSSPLRKQKKVHLFVINIIILCK